jgi:uncharacterized membrane protein YjdF
MERVKARSIHRRLTIILQVILVIGLVFSLYERQWLNTLLILGIIFLSVLPHILSKRMQIYIPPQFEMLAILFIFASIFLGETRNFYIRYRWWDIMLHTGSGFLLGIFGFLLVYALNEDEHIQFHMKPRFVALFSFVFAVAVGAVWEIFEFALDGIFGLNMQKEMLGDPSGLIDTMWDLIVDTLGAAFVSILGYFYISKSEEYWLERWINRFVEDNPRLFRRGL